ncbi:related to Exocyst complex component SEC10 [Saccharomycodes ludwigii]|uniref:Related to Exocyst complex component SEC10 n=1 Tax=Saccharomycodes ludwigii TaxID=36035 RepID=A0A376B7W0_9ASCO|nr:hypothetical protein SCDLUD_001856 [Saccharomycodes ludwigii]KAH3902045.1 hypothetical protein SCDLUD_001856 [Saccharomycodes ludwigii]SSD60758.1 related to Exocyst complex component SEC10 [Saccharomycodes ludwigii]
MNSLYELDPKWKKLLVLDNFLGGLTVQEFVQELCKDQELNNTKNKDINIINGVSSPTNNDTDNITNNDNGNMNSNNNSNDINDTNNITSIETAEQLKNLDPKPYIRTLESTLKELQNLHVECTGKRSFLESQVYQAEIEHSKNVLEIIPEFSHLTNQFEDLDHDLTNVNHTIAPLSFKMEKSIRSKTSYVESVALLKYYQDFYENGESKALISGFADSASWKVKAKVAVTVKNLLVITQKVETKTLPKTITTTKAIQKYAQDIENSLLDDFNKSYREKNYGKLKEIALVLNYYNSGENVIHSFINQHPFFIDATKLKYVDENTGNMSEEFRNKLENPDIHTTFYHEEVVNLLDVIITTIGEESKIIKEVFEDKVTKVMQLFIQRIFAQILDPKVESLLTVSMSLSNLAYVRMLHGLHSLFAQFIKDLQDFFSTEYDGAFSSVNGTLETCYQDLFAKHLLDRAKYFDFERRSLEGTLMNKASIYNMEHEQDIQQRYLYDHLNSNVSKLEIMDTISSSLTAKKFQQLNTSFNTFIKSHLDKVNIDKNVSLSSTNVAAAATNEPSVNKKMDATSNFKLSLVDSMLRSCVESLARVMELVAQKSSEYSYEIVEVSLMGIVSSYIESGLEVAYSSLVKLDTPESIDSTPFNYICKSTEMLSLISASIKTIILPLLSNTPTIKKKVIDLTNAYLKRCELMTNAILLKAVQISSDKFATSLAKQKKKDYLLKEMQDQDTQPVVEIVYYLDHINKVTSQFLKGDNLSNFLYKIGHNLYKALLEHYKKFQVNSIGSLVLTKDIIGYQTAIEKWGNFHLNEEFSTLRELANLFSVQPELLESLTKEGHLANVNREIIGIYISNRDDFNNNGILSRLKSNLR